MIRLRTLLFVCCVLCLTASAQQVRYNFNRGWLLSVGDPAAASELSFDDSRWKRVTLPHAWNEDFAYRVSIHDLPTGIAWYGKHFSVSVAHGQRVAIEFEGVRQAAEVFLNGHRLGLSENGVMAFGDGVSRLAEPTSAGSTRTRIFVETITTGAQVRWTRCAFRRTRFSLTR